MKAKYRLRAGLSISARRWETQYAVLDLISGDTSLLSAEAFQLLSTFFSESVASAMGSSIELASTATRDLEALAAEAASDELIVALTQLDLIETALS